MILDAVSRNEILREPMQLSMGSFRIKPDEREQEGSPDLKTFEALMVLHNIYIPIYEPSHSIRRNHECSYL